MEVSDFVDLLDKEMYELEIDCLKRELEAHKKGKQELCKDFGVCTIAQLKDKFKNLPKQICDEIYNGCYNYKTSLFDCDDIKKIIKEIQKKYEEIK